MKNSSDERISGFIAIGLFVQDFQKAFDYYKNILCLTVITEDIKNEFAEFQIGNTTIGLVTKNTAKHMFDLKYFGTHPTEEQFFTITVKVDSIDVFYKQISDMNVTIMSIPKVMPWGWKIMCIKDIEGYIWEICELPK